MRRAVWAIAILLFCLHAQAADYWHLQDYVTMKSGYAVSGASVQVYNADTEVNPTAYTDLAGSAASFPLTTDTNGMFQCYLADGNYDIVITHTGWNIDTTWDNYMVGTGSDSLGFVSADSVRIDGDGTTADLRFGRASDTVPTGRVFIPNNHTLYFRRSGGTARRVDGLYDYTFGVGANSIQFEEGTSLDWAFACATDSTYDDRAVLCLDDSSAGDSLGTQIYQTIWFRNTRAESTDWMMPGGTVKGALAGDWGTPDRAAYFYTNMPDSAATIGFEFRWDPAGRTNSPLNSESSIVNMQFGNDNIDYSFQRIGLVMQAAPASTDEKVIKWDGGDDYTLLSEVDGTATVFRVNHGLLNILDDDQSDDATVTVQHLALVTHATDGPPDTTGILPNTFWADGDTLWWRPRGAAFIQVAP